MEITAIGVLKDDLEIHREQLRIASEKYTGLIAKKGMEKQFEEERQKCWVLEDLIRGLQSEGVRAEMAKWQRDCMDRGGPPEKLDI